MFTGIAGFLLRHAASSSAKTHRQDGGIFGGISNIPPHEIPPNEARTALTSTLVKNIKPIGSPFGDKHADGGGMYLLVNSAGKYWRMNYRFAEKRKTLALGM